MRYRATIRAAGAATVAFVFASGCRLSFSQDRSGEPTASAPMSSAAARAPAARGGGPLENSGAPPAMPAAPVADRNPPLPRASRDGGATASDAAVTDAGTRRDARSGEAAARQTATASSAPQPLRVAPFEFLEEAMQVQVVPAFHPAPQPAIVVLADTCGKPTDPGCPLPRGIGPGYGWLVCLRRTDSGSDAAAAVARAVGQLSSRYPRALLPRGGVIAACGAGMANAAAVHRSEPERWPYVLVIDADATESSPDWGTTVPVRTAIVRRGAPPERSSLRQAADALRARGGGTGWFAPERDPGGRTGSLRSALAWLFAGPTSDLCGAEATREPGAHACTMPEAPDASSPRP